jgi:hypothetical protein
MGREDNIHYYLDNILIGYFLFSGMNYYWTTQSKGEDHSLVKPRQTSISLDQNIICCHIRNPKRLPTANSELHPKSEPVTTQQKFAPEIVEHRHLCIIFYYILIFNIFINFNILQFTILTCNIDIL